MEMCQQIEDKLLCKTLFEKLEKNQDISKEFVFHFDMVDGTETQRMEHISRSTSEGAAYTCRLYHSTRPCLLYYSHRICSQIAHALCCSTL